MVALGCAFLHVCAKARHENLRDLSVSHLHRHEPCRHVQHFPRIVDLCFVELRLEKGHNL